MRTQLIPPRWETPDPPDAVGTYGDKAISWARRRLGITPGPWQAHVIRKVLRYKANGDLCASVALVSTARQNGKSVIVRIVIGWLLDEGRCIGPFREWRSMLAAAHDVPQARIIYEAVYADMLGLPELVSEAQGNRFERTVRLTDFRGMKVGDLAFNTATSQPGSVRGKSPGLIAWDEVLTQRDWSMWQALKYAQAAQRSPLMLMTSTAGDLDSVLLRDWYDRLVRQSSGDEAPDPTFYGVWWQSQDPEAGLDWRAVAEGNPALPDGRLSRDFIKGEFGGPRELWRQERLNHWLDVIAAGAFAPGQWAKCRTETPLQDAPGPFALGVAVGPDWQRATVAVAGLRSDGRVGVEILSDLRATEGRALTSDDVLGAVHAYSGYAVAIAYEAAGAGAPAFRADAEETGDSWDPLTPSMIVAASMDVAELVQAGLLAHDDPLLDAQVALTGRKAFGQEGLFRFARSASAGPVDAVLAMTFAAHAVRFAVQGLAIY